MINASIDSKYYLSLGTFNTPPAHVGFRTSGRMNATISATSKAGTVKPKMKMDMPLARAIDKIAEARDTFRSSRVPRSWIASLNQILAESDEVFE